MIVYQTVKQFMYRVIITNVKNGNTMANYLIKTEPEYIEIYSKGIHKNYPSSIIKVDITKA